MLINSDRFCWEKNKDIWLSSLPDSNKLPFLHSIGRIHMESLDFYPYLALMRHLSYLLVSEEIQWETECSASPRHNEATLSSETTRGTRTSAQRSSNKDHFTPSVNGDWLGILHFYFYMAVRRQHLLFWLSSDRESQLTPKV